MPRSLDEASFMDGANWRQKIFKIILPASKAAMIIIAMFAFMEAWGKFILASFLRVQILAAYIYQTASGQNHILERFRYTYNSVRDTNHNHICTRPEIYRRRNEV